MDDRLQPAASRNTRAPEAPSGFKPKSSATLLKASLGSGTLAVNYKLEMSGWDADTLAQSAAAETKFTWSGGALRISPDPRMPLRVLNGEGKAVLDKDGWTISACKWNTPAGIYQLSGTASRDSVLALEFTQENGAVSKVQERCSSRNWACQLHRPRRPGVDETISLASPI